MWTTWPPPCADSRLPTGSASSPSRSRSTRRRRNAVPWRRRMRGFGSLSARAAARRRRRATGALRWRRAVMSSGWTATTSLRTRRCRTSPAPFVQAVSRRRCRAPSRNALKTLTACGFPLRGGSTSSRPTAEASSSQARRWSASPAVRRLPGRWPLSPSAARTSCARTACLSCPDSSTRTRNGRRASSRLRRVSLSWTPTSTSIVAAPAPS